MQVLHAGRYGYHPFSVGASSNKSPITPFKPHRAVHQGRRPDGHATSPSRAPGAEGGLRRRRDHGVRGLPDQPVPRRPHQRPHRPVGRQRHATGCASPSRSSGARASWSATGFPIMYRISLLDLVEGGQTWDEVVELAGKLEEAGVTVFNTGIGWHEARVPTIITQVPRGRLGERHRAARPRSSTCRCARPTGSTPPSWPRRSSPPARPTWCRWRGRSWPTRSSSPRRSPTAPTRSTPASPATRPASTTSSANRRASCLVNPRACHETELVLLPTLRPATVAVVGAGPAGLAAAVNAAERGFTVTLFEKHAELGGQFRLAMQVPGKEDFADTLRYFTRSPRGARRRRADSDRGQGGRPRGVRPHDRRQRRHAAHPRHRGHRPPQGRVVRRRCSTARSPSASGWR